MKNPIKSSENPFIDTDKIGARKVIGNIKNAKPIGKAIEHLRKVIYNK